MRTVFLYVWLLLVTVPAGIAACEKEEVPPVAVVPPPPPPLPPVPPPVVSSLCTNTRAVERDTVFARVEQEPTESFGVVYWMSQLALPQVTAANTDCVRVYVAQDGSTAWHELAWAIDNFEAGFWANPGSLLIIAIEGQQQVPAIDFTKKINVRVSYKSL